MPYTDANLSDFNVFRLHGFKESPFHPLGVTRPTMEEVPFPVGVTEELCKIIQWIKKTISYSDNDLYLVVGEYGAGKTEILKYIKRYIEKKYGFQVIYTFLKYPLCEVNDMVKRELEDKGLDSKNLTKTIFIIIDEADDFERDLKTGRITKRDLSNFIKSLRRFLEPEESYGMNILKNIKLLFGAGPQSYKKMEKEAVEVIEQRIREQKIMLQPPEEWQVIGFARRRMYFYADKSLREILNDKPYFPFTKGVLRTIALMSRVYHPQKEYSLRFASQLYDKLLFYSCKSSTSEVPQRIDHSLILKLLKSPEIFGINDEEIISHFKGIYRIMNEYAASLSSEEEKTVFFYLFIDDEPKSPEELSEELNIETGDIKRLLLNLENKRLIEKCYMIFKASTIAEIKKKLKNIISDHIEREKVLKNIIIREYNTNWDPEHGSKDLVSIIDGFLDQKYGEELRCGQIKANEFNEIIMIGDISSAGIIPYQVVNIIKEHAEHIKYKILPQLKESVILKKALPPPDHRRKLTEQIQKSSLKQLQLEIINNVSSIISSSPLLRAKIREERFGGIWDYLVVNTSDGLRFTIFFLPEFKLQANSSKILKDLIEEVERKITPDFYLILFYDNKNFIENALKTVSSSVPMPLKINERVFWRRLTWDEFVQLFGYDKLNEEEKRNIENVIVHDLINKSKDSFLKRADNKGLIIKHSQKKINRLADTLNEAWTIFVLKNIISSDIIERLREINESFVITQHSVLSAYERNILYVFGFYRNDEISSRELEKLLDKIFIKKLCRIKPLDLLNKIMIDIKHVLVRCGENKICLPSQSSLKEIFRRKIEKIENMIRELETIEEVKMYNIHLKLDSSKWIEVREKVGNCKKNFEIFVKELPDSFYFDNFDKFLNQVVSAAKISTKIYLKIFSILSDIAGSLSELTCKKDRSIKYIKNMFQQIFENYKKLEELGEVPEDIQNELDELPAEVENLFEVGQIDEIELKLNNFLQKLAALVKGGEELNKEILKIKNKVNSLNKLVEKVEKFTVNNSEVLKRFIKEEKYLSLTILPKENIRKIREKIVNEVLYYREIKPFINYLITVIDSIVNYLSDELKGILHKVEKWTASELAGRLNWLIMRGGTSTNIAIKNLIKDLKNYKNAIDTVLNSLNMDKLHDINLAFLSDCYNRLRTVFKELFKDYYEIVWHITKKGPKQVIDKNELYKTYQKELVDRVLKDLEDQNLITVSYIT